MTQSHRTVYSGGTAETTEKKSRFIAAAAPVTTAEAAEEFIERIKKKYWDASHNCSAYVIGYQNEIQKCSDDGEPSKTAGRPILDVLLGEKIHNTVIVVTRYFGGTLLGTGGLVRAYQRAARESLLNSILIDKFSGLKVRIRTDYGGIGKIMYLISQDGIATLKSEYTDTVTLILLVPEELYTDFLKKINEITGGKAEISKEDKVYYASVNGKIEIFDF